MAGLLATQVLAGALVSRFGSRPVVLAGACGYALGLIPVALAESFAGLALALAFVGVSNGALDLAMNVHGLAVERRLGRPILSSLHAAFSFGALGGAAAGAVVAGAGVGVTTHLPVAAGAGVAAVALLTPSLLPRAVDAAPEGPRYARPTRALLVLGLFAFCVLLSEGAVNDWVAVYLDDDLSASEALAAAGLAVFSLTMALGRLAGDRVTVRLGAPRHALAGGSLAAAGACVAVAAQAPGPAIAGFALMGVGLAALFPLAVRAAATHAGAASVAAVSATGYAGFLAGPPLVGGLAELGGLRLGIAAVAVLCLMAALLAPAVDGAG
jgi:MFS family permease